jgi:hypothetical protein
MKHALIPATTPPPSRAELARYAARRIGRRLIAQGFNYGNDNRALLRLVRFAVDVLELHPHDNRIVAIDLSHFEDFDEPLSDRLSVLLECASGHMSSVSLPATPARRITRHEARKRVRDFTGSMADALEAADRQAIARTRQAAFHVIEGTTP